MRIEGDFIKINDWLLPFSWLYGLAVRFRNQLFEIGRLIDVISCYLYVSVSLS